MSLDDLQRRLFEQVRAGDPDLDDGSPLTDGERTAVATRDVGELWLLGVHPVLLNSWCRLIGLRRDQYRALLVAVAPSESDRTEVPWRRS
jgi:hypothetical protein